MRTGSVDYSVQPYVCQPPAEAEQKKIVLPRPDEQFDLAAVFERAEKNENAAKAKSSGPSDHSGRLTQRLVAAKFPSEVYAIISEAHKNLSEWLEAAMGGDAKAFAAIRRLNKLIRRAGRKAGDLIREDVQRGRQKQAERMKQEQLAAERSAELRRMMAVRKRREREYLSQPGSAPGLFKAPSPAELEAKMLALAGAMTDCSFTDRSTDQTPADAGADSPAPPPPASGPAIE